MEYVAIGILFMLVVGAGVTMFVMASTKNSERETAEDGETSSGTPFSGAGGDDTPAGDTSQHAGEQSASGETVTSTDAGPGGGTGQPAQGPAGDQHARDEETPPGRFKRDPVGGEAEGQPTIAADPQGR